MTSGLSPVQILLVDDLDENLLSLEALLGSPDRALLKARSGEEALELLLVHDVALALLDVQMPGMDGFELAEFLRGNERTRLIPIIFLTAGSTDAQRRFRGYEAGAVDFIQKPIEAEVLRGKVQVFCDLHRQRQIVASQRDELEAAARSLLAADRRKDEFLAVLAHELRNPLAAFQAGLHLLAKRHDEDSTRDIRAQMDRQAGYLSRLVEDLLDVSRLSEGKISLRLERVALRDVVEGAVETCRPLLEAGAHRFAVELPFEPIWIEADPVRLAQVVANLVGNAAKYTPSGGSIAIRAKCAAGNVEIEVSDDGLGVPPDMQARIFDIFAQVDAHRERAGGGLGIGLALVRQLVELHGGSILLTSPGEGAGSVFTVSLPVVVSGNAAH